MSFLEELRRAKAEAHHSAALTERNTPWVELLRKTKADALEDADNNERRLLLHAKNNLAAPPQGLAFSLQQTIVGEPGKGIVASRVDWERDPVTITANEALAAESGSAGHRPSEEAESFLRELLADGPVPAKQVKADAEAAGLTWATVRRAKERLGIKPHKAGMDAGWVWSPPQVLNQREDAHVYNVSTFGPDEHLRPMRTRAPIAGAEPQVVEMPNLPVFLDRRAGMR